MKKLIYLLSFLLFAFYQQTIAFPGDLDLSFNNNGIKITEYSPSFSAPTFQVASAIQADGKIVFAGQGMTSVTGGTVDSLIVIRYNADGSYDSTFGTGGFVRTNIGNFEGVANVLIQPDGKIIVAGERYNGNTRTDFSLVRYNTDGSLDNTFDGNGLAVANIVGVSNERGGNAVLQPDGKIVVVGQTDNQTEYASLDWAVVRFNADGSLDSTFNGDGKIVIPTSGDTEDANSVALQENGKIVVTGFSSNGTDNDFTTIRLNSNGSLDQSFGVAGIVKTPIGSANEVARNIKIQADGKILVAGGTDNATNSDIALIRYNENGTLDSSYGTNGIVIAEFQSGSSEAALDLQIQPDGKALVSSNMGNNAGLIRFNTDGSIDSSFGTGGRVSTEILDFTKSYPFSIALQNDGKIVISGVAFWLASSGPTYFFTARYNNSATAKTQFDFDGDGKSDVSVFRPSAGAWYLNQSTNGFTGVTFGADTDLITPADYDGDGKTDVAVFRPSNGAWYRLNSSDGAFVGITFGQNGDKPLLADFDGDGKNDIAVFRPSSNGTFYWLESSTGQFKAVAFGVSTDIPTLGDFDGDGKTDIAVFRPSNGAWYRYNSTNGAFIGITFGQDGDVPVAADYDGDGKTDIAVFRPSNGAWYRLNSSNGAFVGLTFGFGTDKPIPAAF